MTEDDDSAPEQDGSTPGGDASTGAGDGAQPMVGSDAGVEQPAPMGMNSSGGKVVLFSEQAGTWVIYRDRDNKAEALNQETHNRMYVSPDGTKLLTDEAGTLKVYNAADRMAISMLAGTLAGGWVTNSRMVVSAVQFNARRGLKIVDIDGSNPVELAPATEGVIPADPPVSFDGKKLLWLEANGSSHKLGTADADGTNVKTYGTKKQVMAFAMSRDGRVVYALNSEADGKMFVIPASLEGAGQQVSDLTSVRGIRPWHPASHVLVASETTGQGGKRIATFFDVDLDSGQATPQPNWDAAGTLIEKIQLSPDGTKALFTAGKEVKIADRDGSNAAKVNSGYGSAQIARW